MKTGLMHACLLVSVGAGLGCNEKDAQTTASTCLTSFMTALQAGGTCGAWSTFECCLKDAYTAAGCDAAQANTMLTSTRATSPALSECAASTCSGSSNGDGNTFDAGANGNVEPEGRNCDMTAAQATGNTCLTALTQGLAGGAVCNAWATFECCLKDGYSAAGCETSQANTMLSTTRSMQPALSECASPACSGSSEVITTLVSHVRYPASFDPTTFDMDTYIEAVKTAVGVSTIPVAALKTWEILVSYLVPAGSELASLKAAIVSHISVEDSAVTLTTATRRLGQGSGLDTQVDAKIIVPDAATAKGVKTSAANVDELATVLGGAVTVKAGSEPAAVAVIETVITSDGDKAKSLQNLITGAGAAVGGTITAEVVSTSNSGGGSAEETASATRSSSIMLAALVLLRIVL